jgi:lysophospholipase L1-like esterase
VPELDLFTPDMPIGSGDYNRQYSPDGLHPNNAGHEILADKLQKFLENI